MLVHFNKIIYRYRVEMSSLGYQAVGRIDRENGDFDDDGFIADP